MNKLVKSSYLKSCKTAPEDLQVKAFTIVIFGGAGDLSKRKLLPALFHLYQQKLITKFSIIGLGRTKISDSKYRDLAKNAVKKISDKTFNEKNWHRFSQNLFYESLNITEEASYKILCNRVHEFFAKNQSNNLIYYLAIPPSTVPKVVEMLALRNMCRHEPNAKIIIEKPFGKDKKGAIKLDATVLKEFDEHQVYRIDHYLGKETVQNIIFFRFGNNIFEPLWNRNYIDHVQITVAESIGIENRGRFYEETGVIRDIVQNHLMQLLSLIAMEPPVGFDADLIRNEKATVLRAVRPLTNVVLGQYNNYRKEQEVKAHSKTPTYFAGKFYIDNWRWAGVPFYIRTGKALANKKTEIIIEFKHPPLKLLGRVCDIIPPNTLTICIQPQEQISLSFSVKYPGTANRPHPVDMQFNYQDAFKIKLPEAYERLLLDCMKGDQTLYARQDEIELMWGIVDPVINNPPKLTIYKTGSQGPKAAEQLIKKDRKKWHEL
jgi:glucose-6-phosphate 1-dehydrogenase